MCCSPQTQLQSAPLLTLLAAVAATNAFSTTESQASCRSAARALILTKFGITEAVSSDGGQHKSNSLYMHAVPDIACMLAKWINATRAAIQAPVLYYKCPHAWLARQCVSSQALSSMFFGQMRTINLPSFLFCTSYVSIHTYCC